MARANTIRINQAFKDFQEEVERESLREVELYAQNIVLKAVQYRMEAPGAHNFTGNLLNSIVAAVYFNKDFKKAFFSGESGIKEPRMYEMTASHGRYIFKVDYSGDKWSKYTPEIETLRRKGLDDAYEFVSTFTPNMNGYLVVVAYTTEYANFVEMERGTTGFLNTKKYAGKLGIQKFLLQGKGS